MTLKVVDTFLENAFVPIYGLTLIVAMIRYPNYFDTSLKYFPILLLYTFLNELLGDLIYKYDSFSLAFNDLYSDSYIIIYTLYNIGFFLYFFYLFGSYIQNSKYKVFIKYGSILFILTCIINPFFQDLFREYQYLIFFTGASILMVSVVLYLLEQMQKPIGELKNSILFWIAIGLLIYHLGYIPIKGIRYHNELIGVVEEPYIRQTHLILILIMYTCIIIGFLRMKKRLAK